jgi:hypothetical protein
MRALVMTVTSLSFATMLLGLAPAVEPEAAACSGSELCMGCTYTGNWYCGDGCWKWLADD